MRTGHLIDKVKDWDYTKGPRVKTVPRTEDFKDFQRWNIHIRMKR